MFRRKRILDGAEPPWSGRTSIVGAATGSSCGYPRCDRPADDVVSIQELTGPRAIQLQLCGYHAKRARDGAGIAEFLFKIGEPATAAQRVTRNSAGGELRRLDRREYIDRAATYLQSTDYFLGAFLASCFHPDWFFSLQAGAERKATSPSPGSSTIDAAVKALIFAEQVDLVRVIVRLSEVTYVAKVAAVTTDPRLLAILKEDTCRSIEEFYALPRQQQITGFAVGHERLPYIFRDCVITAQRSNAADPVDYAILSTDPNVVEFEQRSFMLLFEQCMRSAAEERESLTGFVSSSIERIMAGG